MSGASQSPCRNLRDASASRACAVAKAILPGSDRAWSDRAVIISGEKLIVHPDALDVVAIRRDQHAVPVALAVPVFAVEHHVGFAVLGPAQDAFSRCEPVFAVAGPGY